MPFLDSAVLDSGLSALTGISSPVLHLCHTEPTTRANTLTQSVGNKSGITIGSPGARSPNGRKVTIAAITGGSITATSTGSSDDAQYWAIIDGTKLWAAGSLASAQMVTNGNTFDLAAFDIGIPAP